MSTPRKISNKQPKFTLNELEKEQKKPKVSRCKEITKIMVEINKMETKKTIEKINEVKSCF